MQRYKTSGDILINQLELCLCCAGITYLTSVTKVMRQNLAVAYYTNLQIIIMKWGTQNELNVQEKECTSIMDISCLALGLY